MGKKINKKADGSGSAHIALHELHYDDPDFGQSVISAGSEIPEGVFTEEQLAVLVGKRAVAPPAGTVSAKAEVATSDDLDEITGTAGDDGLGDEGGEGDETEKTEDDKKTAAPPAGPKLKTGKAKK